MPQVFTACVRRTKDGAFLPYVDVADHDRHMEWEELHPDGSVADEATAHERATQLALELRRGDPAPSPGERYRRAHDAGQPQAAVTDVSLQRSAMARFVTRFNLHQELLSGDRHRAQLAETA